MVKKRRKTKENGREKSGRVYKIKALPFSGTKQLEVFPQARQLLRAIARRTKRRPYIRSAYFGRDKIFFTFLWQHLNQKSLPEQVRRLKYLPC